MVTDIREMTSCNPNGDQVRLRDMVAFMRSAPLLLAGVLLSAAACASPPSQTETAAQQPVTTPVCPDTLPPLPTAGPAKPMVPGTPGAAVVCHYPAPNPGGPAPLAKSDKVADVNGLVTALNAANTTPPPRGTMCPMDTGTSDIVIFAYATGDPMYVTVRPTGCATATNGKAMAYQLTQAVLGKL